MRLSFLATFISAVIAAASPLGSLPSEEAKEMTKNLAHIAKAIDVDDCKVAKAQLQVLQHSLADGIVEGHVEDEKQLVKYITRDDGKTMLDKVQQIRDNGGNIKLAREISDDETPSQKPSGPKDGDSGRTGAGRRKGWKGRKGKGKGKSGGPSKGKSGGQSKGNGYGSGKGRGGSGSGKGRGGSGRGGSKKGRRPRDEEIVLEN